MDSRHRFKPWERAKFIEAHGFVCAYCGATGDRWRAAGAPWNIDHIVPVMRGGRGDRDWSNLALSCATCNDLKSNRLLSELPEWFAELRQVPWYAQFGDHMDRMLAHIAVERSA